MIKLINGSVDHVKLDDLQHDKFINSARSSDINISYDCKEISTNKLKGKSGKTILGRHKNDSGFGCVLPSSSLTL